LLGISEHVDIGREQIQKRIDSLIESATWNMYAERFGTAQQELEQARIEAINIRDKARIDKILTYLAMCDRREKPKL
jgi:hypothetical protein